MPTPADDDLSSRPHWSSTRSLVCRKRRRSLPCRSIPWKRHHADKVVELSPRRLGVRLRDALMLRKTS